MRRAILLVTVGVSIAIGVAAIAATPIGAAEFADRLETAHRLAQEGTAAPSPVAMEAVRAALGLPARVDVDGSILTLPADPFLARLEGREADDFQRAVTHLEQLQAGLEDALGAEALDRASLEAALDEAYRGGIQVRPGLIERIRRAVLELLEGLLYRIISFHGGDSILAWAVVLALLVLAVWLLRRLRLVPGRAIAPGTGERGGRLIDWRGRAEEALRAGDLVGAVHALYRSLLATLAGRGLLIERPGLTAGECRGAVRASNPSLYDVVAKATRRFERVAYGGVPPRHEDVDLLREAEATARSA